jgi:uncharacterized protein (TIGR00295 family)
MTTWPARTDCRRALKDAGADVRLIEHVEAVERVAASIAALMRRRGHRIDPTLVTAGALLHDLGRTRTHGIDHAAVGAQMVRERGWPEPLALIVERHTGGGIDANEAATLGLPPKDYTPRTLEEKIVCQADNLVDGARRQKVQEELDHLRQRGLDRVATKIERLHAELSDLAGCDLDDVR